MADLTPEQEQQRLELIQQQNVAAKDLLSTYEKIRKTKSQLTADEKLTVNLVKDLATYSSNLEKTIQKRLDKTASIKDLSKSISQLEKDYQKNLDKSGDIIVKLNNDRRKAIIETRQSLNQELQLKNKLRNLETLISQNEIDKQIAIQNGDNSRAKTLSGIIKLHQDAAKAKEKEIDKVTKQRTIQEDLVKQLRETKKNHESILKEQEKELKLSKEELNIRKNKNTLDAISEKLGLSKLKESFSLLGILTFIVKETLKADQQATNLGKSFGISREMAYGIRQEFVEYSRTSEDAFTNTDRLLKAQSELTAQLGFAVKFSGQEAETFARLTEIVGLSAQEAGNLAKFSAAAGMETKDYVADVRKAAFYAQQSTKTHFTDKQILQEVSKLSAGILVKFQGNPKAIAQAVVQAKKLGSSLEQIDKIGDSLLNWEQSIQNELEAELITGRKINVEKARYAALTGNQLDLTREIANQVGTLADFQNMNVIAQGSLAKAFGLSKDEMAEMLMKQEAINKYGDKAAKLNADQLKDQQESGLTLDQYLAKQNEQRSIQERFNDAILKLQDLLGNLVAGPLGSFLAIITSILEKTYLLYPIMGAIGGIIVGKMLFGMIGFVKQLVLAIPNLMTMVGLSSAKAVAEITAAEAMTLGLGTIGIVAGIVAAVSAMNSAKSSTQNVSDGQAHSSRGPFTVTDSFGATAITAPGDHIAVSPNMRRGNENSSTGIDPHTIVAAFKQALKDQGPTQAYINGKDAFADTMGRTSALGTSQVQSTYRLA